MPDLKFTHFVSSSIPSFFHLYFFWHWFVNHHVAKLMTWLLNVPPVPTPMTPIFCYYIVGYFIMTVIYCGVFWVMKCSAIAFSLHCWQCFCCGVIWRRKVVILWYVYNCTAPTIVACFNPNCIVPFECGSDVITGVFGNSFPVNCFVLFFLFLHTWVIICFLCSMSLFVRHFTSILFSFFSFFFVCAH